MAGIPFVPRPWLELALRRALPAPGAAAPPVRVRIVRLDRARALVEVGHRTLPIVRSAWNGPCLGPSGRPVTLATHRTWGTLREGKRWLGGNRAR